MPALPLTASKEIEGLMSELEKERVARKNIAEEKAALESELESLSQALFEEVAISRNDFFVFFNADFLVQRQTKWLLLSG